MKQLFFTIAKRYGVYHCNFYGKKNFDYNFGTNTCIIIIFTMLFVRKKILNFERHKEYKRFAKFRTSLKY